MNGIKIFNRYNYTRHLDIRVSSDGISSEYWGYIGSQSELIFERLPGTYT